MREGYSHFTAVVSGLLGNMRPAVNTGKGPDHPILGLEEETATGNSAS
jgi:hypothetical protein